MGFFALLRGGIEVKMVSRSWADFAVCHPIPGSDGSPRRWRDTGVRCVTRNECCAPPTISWCCVAWIDGRATGVSPFVALRARVVVDVLAAEDRVAASS